MINLVYAGLDIGTSGCKMVLYDVNGNALYKARRSYREFGEDGYREIDPDIVVCNVKETIKEAALNSPGKIKGLAITSLGESIVCLDNKGKSLCNSMVTGDKRGIEETKRIVDIIGEKEIFEITGLPPSEMYGLPKYMWLNENTDVISKTQYIFFYEDYIGYILTGHRIVSYSSASRSMAFDIRTNEWSEKLLNIAGITSNMMSKPMPSGTIIGRIKKQIAKELYLPEDTMVVVGGHDQNCATLGGGVIAPNIGHDGQGTCEVMSMMITRNNKTDYMIKGNLPYIPYVLKDSYLTAIEITTCGIMMNWCRDTIFEGIRRQCEAEDKDFFTYMNNEAEKIGISDILVLPQFGSSGNPDINYDARGLIWGLTVHSKPVEIYRAFLESMAYQMLMAYETLGSLNINLDTISITGGGSNSPLTYQIRADVFNKKILCLENRESGTLGCMILAATALGEYNSLVEGVNKVVRVAKTYVPNLKNHNLYMEKYKKYKELYKRMHKFK